MTFFEWSRINFTDRKFLAARAGYDNSAAIATRTWDQLSINEQRAITAIQSERYVRGERVPGLKKMKPEKGKGPATTLFRDTVSAMRQAGYSWNDKPAIRMLSNNIMDVYVRRGQFQQWELDKISQDALVKKVMNNLKERGY
jgi:hypothetical protein